MEAEKSHNLPSLRWSESKGLKTGEPVVYIPGYKALEPGALMFKDRRRCTPNSRRKDLLSLCLFVPSGHPTDWIGISILVKQIPLLAYQIKCQSLSETSSEIYPGTAFCQLSKHLLGQSG